MNKTIRADVMRRLRRDTGTMDRLRNQVKEQEGAFLRVADPHRDAIIVSACILAQCTCRSCIDLDCKG